MKKRLIASVTCVCLLLIMLLSSTLAWFTDQTEATKSTMTVGNVEIQQLEQYRDAEGHLQPWHLDYKPAMNPVVPDPVTDELASGKFVINGQEYILYNQDQNPIDKIVTVKNTGSDPAYIRTIFAFEMMKTDAGWVNPIGKEVILHSNVAIIFPKTAEGKDVIIYQLNSNGCAVAAFVIGVATYSEALKSNEISAPSLLQFYLDQKVGNDFSENVGGEYEILALSQAVQTAGFEKYGAEVALNKAFGDAIAQNAAEWFGAPYSTTFKIAVTPENAQAAIWAAQPGDILYLVDEKGTYGDLVIENKDGSPKNDITIEGQKANSPCKVESININSSSNVTLRNIRFEITGAEPVYGRNGASGYASNIIGAKAGADYGAQNVVIDNCSFKSTTNNYDADKYVPISFEEGSRPGVRATNITIKNCMTDPMKQMYDFARLNYVNGTVIVENNTLLSTCKHNILTLTGNSADLIIKNNQFGWIDQFAGTAKADGWNPMKSAISTSRSTADGVVNIEIIGNTFAMKSALVEGEGLVLDIKTNTYTADNCVVKFMGNTFCGSLADMTEADVPCVKP